MKILITGSYGQLGNELRRILAEGRAEIGPIPSEYQGAEVIACDSDLLDISDREATLAFFAQNPCDIVFNCAAVTNVDGCETGEDLAYAVNAIGPQNLALGCKSCGAKLVHVSTDYVFPGTDPAPRVETDAVGPISAYGRTKLAGEQLAMEAWEKVFVARTAWLYGYVGKNFVRTMLRLGAARPQVTVVDDQLGNPTSANDLAYEMLKIALTEDYGVYHCTNNGICSWCEFAAAIMKGAGLACEVVPCTSDEYAAMNPQSARRPAYSALDNAHLRATVGDEMRPWQDALATFLKNMEA